MFFGESQRPGPPAVLDGGGGTPVSEEAVRSELDRILQSSAFRGSRRSQSFLRYVVEKALLSQLPDLKERRLAVELFGRPPSANLSEDTIVRVSAREVRRRLQQFYASEEGAGGTVHIHLPPRSYVPRFLEAHGSGQAPRAPSGERLLTARGAAALLSAAFLGLAAWGLWREAGASGESAIAERFWRPLIGASQDVLVVVPHPIVYQPSPRALRDNAARQPPEPVPLQRPLALRPDQLTGADFIPVEGQYVAVGDLLAVSHLHAMLACGKKSVRMRLASKIDADDLKDSPSFHIGAYSNAWALDLVRNLRFRFIRTPDGRPCIADASDAKRQWALPALARHAPANRDYVLITRILSTQWSQPALLVAGLDQIGTGAGGQLLSDPRRLGAVLSSIRNAQWDKANLQMLLEIRVIGDTPSAPQLVAWHVW